MDREALKHLGRSPSQSGDLSVAQDKGEHIMAKSRNLLVRRHQFEDKMATYLPTGIAGETAGKSSSTSGPSSSSGRSRV